MKNVLMISIKNRRNVKIENIPKNVEIA